MIEPKDIKPVAVTISKTLSSDWNYHKSVKKVQGMYLSWKTVSEELLNELWVAKQAITKGGKRKAGMTKDGELSWSKYIKECFEDVGGPGKRTIDSYLNRYFQAGFTKPGKLTVSTISDHSKLVIRSSVKQADGNIQLDIYLPEFDRSYIQYIAA